MEVSSPKYISNPSVYCRGPPHTAIRVFPKEPYCPRKDQSVPEGTRVSPKEPYHIFGRWPATPYSPILVRQYKYTTCSCLMQNWITDTYSQILYLHISQIHRNIEFLHCRCDVTYLISELLCVLLWNALCSWYNWHGPIIIVILGY